MYTNFEKEILLKFQMAYLFKITENFRFIFLDCNEQNRNVKILFYFYHMPDEVEIELMDDINTEFQAFFSSFKCSEVEYKIDPTSKFNEIFQLRHCVFARYYL